MVKRKMKKMNMNTNLRSQTSVESEVEALQVYKNWRESFALPLLIGVLIFGLAALVPAVASSTSLVLTSIFVLSYLLTAIVTVIRFPYFIRMSVFLLSIYMLGVSTLVTYNALGVGLFYFLALIIFSTMMLSIQAGITAIIINVITYLIFGWLMLNERLAPLNPLSTPANLQDWISVGAATVMFGVVIILGFRSLEREFSKTQKQIDVTLNALKEERNNLENRVQERTQQLRKINEIGQNVIQVLDTSQIFLRAAKFIENEFQCYYAAFYLVDASGKWADVVYASGEAGKILKENKHRLDIAGNSNVAKAIRLRNSQIVSEINQIRLENPLLPYTRSELVLPLLIGDTTLGALDMHSTKEHAFTAQDVDAYQNMANSIAIAIENARLFQEAQQSLAEMRATQRQYLQNAWATLTAERPLEYALGEADAGNENNLQIPLTLRDQIIGQIHMANTAEWTPEQKNLVETIVSQATLALENARLVEESQASAAQERLTNEIIAKIWASTSMDTILQTTVRELGRSLEATEVEIEISMDKQDDK
jgi:GAF domain-containing protein